MAAFEISESKTVPWGPASDLEGVNYDLATIRGTRQCPLFEEGAINDLVSNFNTRDEDTFICTFVKAGTTWTQQIIHLLLNNGEQGEQTYAERIPWLESTTSPILRQWEAPGHTLETVRDLEGPRFFKTHANLGDLPKGQASPKVIYVARNPKDVVVSLFHHAKDKPCFQFNGDFSKMLHMFVEGNAENGSWFKHVLEWHEESKKSDRILFLQYEAMMADPATHVEKIARFIGLDPTPELIATVVEKTSINAMKKNAAVTDQMKKFGINAHIRKGGAGGWKNWFTVRQSEAFDSIYTEIMKDTGLQFDFGGHSM